MHGAVRLKVSLLLYSFSKKFILCYQRLSPVDFVSVLIV